MTEVLCPRMILRPQKACLSQQICRIQILQLHHPTLFAQILATWYLLFLLRVMMNIQTLPASKCRVCDYRFSSSICRRHDKRLETDASECSTLIPLPTNVTHDMTRLDNRISKSQSKRLLRQPETDVSRIFVRSAGFAQVISQYSSHSILCTILRTIAVRLQALSKV